MTRRIPNSSLVGTGSITKTAAPAASFRRQTTLPVFASFAALAFVLVSVTSPLSQSQAVAAEVASVGTLALPAQQLVVAGSYSSIIKRDAIASVEIPKPVVVEPVVEAVVEETPATAKAAKSSASSAAAAAPAAAAPVAAKPDPGSAKAIAHEMVLARGWGEDQYNCLVSLWTKESGWNHLAMNKSSGAYGIPQSLPGSKMASAGADWETNPATQITWGLGYITSRYSTPCGAWQASEAKGWY